jgi:hypothetical protein
VKVKLGRVLGETSGRRFSSSVKVKLGRVLGETSGRKVFLLSES